mmetsp:Transcript_9704/g.58842  ORF Transcript_9704/g.58842 Transcript_9704/m.58842 type:complete len:258 (+) Transcript_9704:1592-2365(+)
MLLRKILCIVSTIEVLTGKARLAASHVAADDEMGATVVFADNHMLNGFPRTGHVHGVGKICPAHLGVVHFLLKDLIGVITDDTWNIVVLSGTTGRMHQAHCTFSYVLCAQGTSEEFVVCPVDGVPALERHHVLAFGEHGTHLFWCRTRKDSLWQPESFYLASNVVLAPFHGDHLHAGMFQGGGSIALECFQRFVGFVLGIYGEHCKVLSFVAEQDLVSYLDGLVVGVQDHRQAQDGPIREPHGFHDRVVVFFVEEPF